MAEQSRFVGLLEVAPDVEVKHVGDAVIVSFDPDAGAVGLDLNGRHYEAGSTEKLARLLDVDRNIETNRLLHIPYQITVEGSAIVIRPDASTTLSRNGFSVGGAVTGAALIKAQMVLETPDLAWPLASEVSSVDMSTLESRMGSQRWDGPLVVSMPRTGSTLMGILFLFCKDSTSTSGRRFDRYLHEPAAPIYWSGLGVDSITGFISGPLDRRDIVQESAYQFAHPDLARWFLTQARPPVIFTVRHPQLAWPSRWRLMLAQRLAESPEDPDAALLRTALESDDFSGVGDYLTRRVRPADNGWYSFLSLMNICVTEGIEFAIVDNTRFRSRPAASLEELCTRLGIEVDESMTEWTDLSDVRPRIAMTDLALGDEYEWYYKGTLGSDRGILPETHPLLEATRFPPLLRGSSDQWLTVDEAVTWHQLLLTRPEALA